MADISTGQILKDAVAGYGQTTDAVRDRVGTERAVGQERLQGTTEAALGMIDEQAFLAQQPCWLSHSRPLLPLNSVLC